MKLINDRFHLKAADSHPVKLVCTLGELLSSAETNSGQEGLLGCSCSSSGIVAVLCSSL